MPWPSFIERRVAGPIRALLRTGLTPRAIALSIATGTIVGIFPLLGTTTLLCVTLSLTFRLNIVAMQAFNWLVAGMQLLLILPFIRLGEHLYAAAPLSLTPADIEALFRTGFLHAIRTLGISLLHAVSGWLLIAPFLFAAAYGTAHVILRRMPKRTLSEPSTVDP